MLSDLSVGHNK